MKRLGSGKSVKKTKHKPPTPTTQIRRPDFRFAKKQQRSKQGKRQRTARFAFDTGEVPPCLFPSNARWLSPGRLSSRKDNSILQIHRINAVATSAMQKRTE